MVFLVGSKGDLLVGFSSIYVTHVALVFVRNAGTKIFVSVQVIEDINLHVVLDGSFDVRKDRMVSVSIGNKV